MQTALVHLLGTCYPSLDLPTILFFIYTLFSLPKGSACLIFNICGNSIILCCFNFAIATTITFHICDLRRLWDTKITCAQINMTTWCKLAVLFLQLIVGQQIDYLTVYELEAGACRAKIKLFAKKQESKECLWFQNTKFTRPATIEI